MATNSSDMLQDALNDEILFTYKIDRITAKGFKLSGRRAIYLCLASIFKVLYLIGIAIWFL